MREQLKRFQIPVGIALALLLFAVLFRAKEQVKVEPTPVYVKQAWYFDLNTQKLFTAPRDSPNPISTDSGDFEDEPAGVRAHIFTCTGCDDPDEAIVGWLFKPDMEALADGDGRIPFLVREPGGEAWHFSSSPEGMAIADLALCPEGHEPHYCWPPSELVRFETRED